LPIINPDDAEQLDKHLRKYFAVTSVERANVLREMFVSEMDFESAQGVVPLQPSPSNVVLPESGELIASADGFNVVFVALNVVGTDRVRKAEAVQIARRVEDVLGPDMVLLLSNTTTTQLHFIYPTFETANPTLRRIVIERDLPRRTAVQQLSNCYHEWQSTTLRQALMAAYDVEVVTRRFFEEYSKIFDQVESTVEGFGISEDELEARHLFTQTLFNRLMFVYFISRKGWLTFQGSKDYLAALWSAGSTATTEFSFYKLRLQPLFFSGLNNELNMNATEQSSTLEALIGKVPFLNGGLFDETEIEEEHSTDIPDDSIAKIIGRSGIFERFNFTILESTPFDVEVAVDPEMLGKVFEELVANRHGSGSYYTPRSVVSFMCKEALKTHLESKIGTSARDVITAFVDTHETQSMSLDQAQAIGNALSGVRVLDPACGSGAYLLGMMQELVELSSTLYTSDLEVGSKTLYELKLHIIERNLHGADIDEFAVNIAMLRLWLSLEIELEGGTPEPLPNLEFKIVTGDSLSAPSPTDDAQIEMFHQQAELLTSDLIEMKHVFIAAFGEEKESARGRILELESELSRSYAYSYMPADAIDWRTSFAEVYTGSGGFDVVLANPPYLHSHTMTVDRKIERQEIAASYVTAKGNWDYYIPFWERSISLLNSEGTAFLITPNKWLSVSYGTALRDHLRPMISQISDLSSYRVFESAGVFPVIVGAKKSGADQLITRKFNNNSSIDLEVRLDTELRYKFQKFGLLLSPHIELISEMIGDHEQLGSVCDVEESFTVGEAYTLRDYLKDGNPPNDSFKFVNTGTIDPFVTTWGKSSTRYLKADYRKPYLTANSLEQHYRRRYGQALSPKILLSGMRHFEAFFDEDATYIGGISTVTVRNWAPTIQGFALLAILNSSTSRFFLNEVFGSLGMDGGINFTALNVREIPIPTVEPKTGLKLAKLAKQLSQSLKKSESDRRASDEIDLLVCEAYGFSKSDIETIQDAAPARIR
jgi:hypothetical protein